MLLNNCRILYRRYIERVRWKVLEAKIKASPRGSILLVITNASSKADAENIPVAVCIDGITFTVNPNEDPLDILDDITQKIERRKLIKNWSRPFDNACTV